MSEEGLYALIGGITILTLLFCIVTFIFVFGIVAVMLVSQWKIFVKMGLEGWRGIIPYYNTYVMFDRFWSKKMFVIFVVATLLPAFLSMGVGIVTSIAAILESETFFIIASAFMCIVEGLTCFGLLGIMLVFSIKMAHAFGKSTAFGVGLAFLSPVFFPILAFGKAQYIGAHA